MGNKFQSLSKEKDFLKIYKESCVFKNKGVMLRCIHHLDGLRLAVSVSKRSTTKAVKRNQIKRWIRAISRQSPILKDQNLDIWIVVNRKVDTYENCKKIISELFVQAVDRF